MEDLEDTPYFDEDALPGVVPLNYGENSYDDKGNESIVEGGFKPNINSSPSVHADIP